MIAIDPYLINIVLLCFVAIAFGIVLRYFKQPTVVAYILTGLIVGPNVLGLVKDQDLITHLGSLGVMLLLFFVGMELNISRLLANWKVAILGTLFQIMISVLAVFFIGLFLDWPFTRILLLGFVISLSSTTVIIKILENKNLINTRIGMDVISILIAQDMAVIPMLVILTSFKGKILMNEVALQIIGTILVALFMFWIYKKKEIHLPFQKKLKEDREFQLLAAFVICFGLAIITGLFQLSTALGAFLAGMLIATARETAWVHESLHSFKVLFIAFFFVSIGMLIDISFIIQHISVIALMTLIVLLTNTFVNALIFLWLKQSWKYSLFAGSLLAQIGEFSFLLAAAGLHTNTITIYSYQMTVAIIAITLLLSPIWIALMGKLIEDLPKQISKLKQYSWRRYA
ncbi:MAG: cation:proton antiporter [Nanoarchaeota archaeon]|nr:cation:proton antiporter [Nanoarchaeota archaeon]